MPTDEFKANDRYPNRPGWWWHRVDGGEWTPRRVSMRLSGEHEGKLVFDYGVVEDDGRWGGEIMKDVEPRRASLEALQADRPDLMAITHIEDLRYLVRRFEHETGVRVGMHETIEDCTRALAGAMMSIKATQERTTRALSGSTSATVDGVAKAWEDEKVEIVIHPDRSTSVHIGPHLTKVGDGKSPTEALHAAINTARLVETMGGEG